MFPLFVLLSVPIMAFGTTIQHAALDQAHEHEGVVMVLKTKMGAKSSRVRFARFQELMNPQVTARSRGLYERALYLSRRKRPQWTVVKQLLDRAALEKDARASYALATWSLHGFAPLLIKKDPAKAITQLRLAAQKKIPDALFDLAVSYEKGAGILKIRNKGV